LIQVNAKRSNQADVWIMMLTKMSHQFGDLAVFSYDCPASARPDRA
jgi:hypothetical protein